MCGKGLWWNGNERNCWSSGQSEVGEVLECSALHNTVGDGVTVPLTAGAVGPHWSVISMHTCCTCTANPQ